MTTEFETAFRDAEKTMFALAKKARALLFKLDPQIVEVVWKRQGIAGYGVGPKKPSEHYCYISVHKAHINIGFNWGADLPDPTKLLAGAGKTMRHVKIANEKDRAAPAIKGAHKSRKERTAEGACAKLMRRPPIIVFRKPIHQKINECAYFWRRIGPGRIDSK